MTLNILSLLLMGAALPLAQGSTSKASTAAPGASSMCAHQPCPNTRTGEDPAAIELREAERREKALRDGADDRRRWKALRLYSDTKEPEHLRMSVIKAINFDIELLPKKGLVRFSSPAKAITFRLASSPGAKGDVCPRYNLMVLDASADHAIVRMSCPKYEYAPNRFHMSVEYFLFDWPTRTMRSLWFAGRSSEDAEYPEAKPPVIVTRMGNGYRFKWSGMFPSDNGPELLTLNNSYTREKGSAGQVLVCTDLQSARGEGRENEMCEGRILEAVDAP